MKKKLIRSVVSLILRFFMILTIFLTLSNLDFALAGETLTLTATCTVPAIAGLNAPMIEQESTRVATDEKNTVNQQTNTAQRQMQERLPSMLQAEKETQLQQGAATIPVLIKTLYSR